MQSADSAQVWTAAVAGFPEVVSMIEYQSVLCVFQHGGYLEIIVEFHGHSTSLYPNDRS
jgi:hypothetical protein